jgi:hypothetical protein
MTNEKTLLCLIDKCDIYFENSLISKELIVKKYAEFLMSALSGNGHSVSVALHTGSICFELVSFIMVALASVSFDRTNSEHYSGARWQREKRKNNFLDSV